LPGDPSNYHHKASQFEAASFAAPNESVGSFGGCTFTTIAAMVRKFAFN